MFFCGSDIEDFLFIVITHFHCNINNNMCFRCNYTLNYNFILFYYKILLQSDNVNYIPPRFQQVCDYETNVARNLRIHMTSEKHMHNMMLLQQNMKQIQHSLHMGLAPAEAELYQYYLAQNMGLAGVKLESAAGSSGPDAQMMINPFQIDPATAAALGSGLGE